MLKQLFSPYARFANKLAQYDLRLVDGKIAPPYSCEIDVVDHCNLSCFDCNHASPAVKKRYVSPDQVFHDFHLLAKVYKPQVVKVLGGEPLLHPRLLDVIAAIRQSGICPVIYVITNGLLLPRMTDAFWQAIDILEISCYPDAALSDEQLRACQAKAKQHGVKLLVYYYEKFRPTFVMGGYEQTSLVRQVYRHCHLAHLWGCHVIHEGYFYKCPQSIYIPQLRGAAADKQQVDGIQLKDTPGFIGELFDYLSSQEPLQSCSHCLGNYGKERPHTQTRSKNWLREHELTVEASLDVEKLQQSEAGIIVADTGKKLLAQYRAN
jgi:cyclic pyranopterin phosphate synthase